MELKFRVSGRISRPVHEVFEAVADPAELSSYFTTGGSSGRLEKGQMVTWEFADYPGAFPVEVVDVVKDKLILLRWNVHDDESGDDLKTEVTMRFSDCGDGRTLVEIAEEGWGTNQKGLKTSYGNCEGWTQMLCAMKMWTEHRINLREGYYK